MQGQLTEFMRERLAAAWSDEAFLESVEQIASKSLLREMSASDELEKRTWTFAEPVVHRHAAMLSYLAGTLSIEEGPEAEPRRRGAPQDQALRLARLWECLASLGEKTPSGRALLNAACAYELAGHQANAACLSRRFDEAAAEKEGLWGIASAFLQRRFVGLGAECAPLAKEPDYDKADDLPYALGLATAASSLSSLGRFFLTGDRARVDEAAEGLGSAEKIFSESGFYHESVLTHGLRALAVPMASRSTWAVLGNHAEGHFAWRRYLMLLARGAGRGLPASDVWPPQRKAVEKGLLASNASRIVMVPAGSGRTMIAEMCILQALTSRGGAAKCVYMAAHGDIVARVSGAMSRVLPDLGFTVSGLDGSYDGEPEPGQGGGADVIVATPEKIDHLLRSRAGHLEGAALFVLDGAGAFGDAELGLKEELLLARLRRRFPRARFIVMPSMMPDDALRGLAAWLCGGGGGGGGGGKDGAGGIIATEWRPTLLRHAMFEWSGGGSQCALTYEGAGEEAGGMARAVRARGVIRREVYEHVDQRTGRVVRPSFPSTEKGETAAELALRFSDLGPVLVYAATKRSAMVVAGALLRRIEMAAAAGRSVPEGLRRRAGRESRRSLLAAEEWLGAGHDVTRLLRRGIAVHHGGLPGRLRRAVEEDSLDGAHGVIVAAGAPSRGAGMPARTVIVHSCRRRSGASGRSERMPAAEYWSLGDLAGRAGHETEGSVIHIVNTATDREDFRHYKRERKGLGGADSRLYMMLDDLNEGRISPDEVDCAIGSEVLGMLAEEGGGAGDSCGDEVADVVSATLSAARAGGRTGGMLERFRAVARSASKLGGERVRVYGATGLGIEGCEAIGLYVRENAGAVGRALTSDSDGGAADAAMMILDAIESVPEMSGRLELGGDREALVRAWFEGNSAYESAEAAGMSDPCESARFIEESLGRYAPWGIAAFTRIAAAELGLDPQGLPPRIRHLAEMVRYGVPRPEAGWAMRLGVATKRAAFQMAADYGGECDFAAFAEWLGGMGRMEAIERYGEDANSAGAAAAAAAMTRANPLLREGRSLGEVLEGGADVVCAGRGGGAAAAARVSEGDELGLERDRGAAHDRNAIAVRVGGSVIGSVERDVAQYLAPEMDCGARIGASAGSVSRGSGGAVTIRMRLWLRGDETG